jgi:hypothetical protein
VCLECDSTCRTCVGPRSDDCVHCFKGAERQYPALATSCCACKESGGHDMVDRSDSGRCEEVSCWGRGQNAEYCLACEDDWCLQCGHGSHWINGECHECRERDCNDIEKRHLALCGRKSVRDDTGICDCDDDLLGDLNVDEHQCRTCTLGCAECTVDAGCLRCEENYRLIDRIPVCVWVGEVKPPPFGYATWDDESGVWGWLEAKLFSVNFSIKPSEDHLYLLAGSYEIPTGHGNSGQTVSWNAMLESGPYYTNDEPDRHDAVRHSTRGDWFDGRYDFKSFHGGLPLTVSVHFWVKPYHAGTILSTNGVHDELSQHVIHVGIRGNRLEAGVQRGDDHHYGHGERPNRIHYGDQFALQGTKDGQHLPNTHYSQTDMDVVTYREWQRVGFSFDYDGFNDVLSFGYYVNNVRVDGARRRLYFGMSAHEHVFPTLNLIGAQERDDAITNMFRGFILDVEAWNYNAVEDMPMQNFSSSCNGGCNVCSDRFSGDCHGECEWNEFLNGVGLPV